MSIWVGIRHPNNWIRCTSGLCFPVSTRISEYWSGSDYMGLTGEKNSKVQSVMEGIHPHFHIWTIFYPPRSNIHHSQRIHPNIHPNIVPIYQEAARKQIVCFSRVDKSCFNSVCSCRMPRAACRWISDLGMVSDLLSRLEPQATRNIWATVNI